jgi:hypothetical protein
MTAQIPETLHHKGLELTLCDEPLGPFVSNNHLSLKFVARSTALWRGYVGTWAIEEGRLYLIKLSGSVEVNDENQEVGLEALFPKYPDGVFAHWFSGELRCPQGGLLKYVHGGYGSVYEEDLCIDVLKGVVTGERTVRNGTAAPQVPQSYGVRAATIFGKE